MSNQTELPDLDRITALRAALTRISETRFGWDGDCGVTRIADDALCADDQASAAQPEGEAPQAARPPATGDEPHGYWLDGEWYGYHPDEQAVEFEVGSTVELTPVWTHGQAATFNVVGSDDSDGVSLVPASPADAALCNWTETPAPAATLSPLCGAQHAEKVSCPECSGTGGVMMEGDCSDCNGKGYGWEPVAAQLDGGQEGSDHA